ncbi:MAG: hypothetical protein LAT63_12245 [Marinobacter sp.]|nr:hypothetical protein [Marinobacter sp.]
MSIREIEFPVFDEVLDQLASRSPDGYEFVSAELKGLQRDHYYYYTLLNTFRIAHESGLMPEDCRDLLDRLEEAFRAVVRKELIGHWKGKEGEGIELFLDIGIETGTQLVRSWVDFDDGEEHMEIQGYSTIEESFVECDELIIINLYNAQRVTKIKLALYPQIALNRTLSGSLYFIQDNALLVCSNVMLEKVQPWH